MVTATVRVADRSWGKWWFVGLSWNSSRQRSNGGEHNARQIEFRTDPLPPRFLNGAWVHLCSSWLKPVRRHESDWCKNSSQGRHKPMFDRASSSELGLLVERPHSCYIHNKHLCYLSPKIQFFLFSSYPVVHFLFSWRLSILIGYLDEGNNDAWLMLPHPLISSPRSLVAPDPDSDSLPSCWCQVEKPLKPG